MRMGMSSSMYGEEVEEGRQPFVRSHIKLGKEVTSSKPIGDGDVGAYHIGGGVCRSFIESVQLQQCKRIVIIFVPFLPAPIVIWT
jgi:hypothetical protein